MMIIYLYNIFFFNKIYLILCFYYKNIEIYNKLEWIVVRIFSEFINYIKMNGLPNIFSFDHDLSHEHSANVNESLNIKTYIENFLKYNSNLK